MDSKPNMHSTCSSRGIALVAVLAILTILSIIACTFIVFINNERISASLLRNRLQAEMLAQSGLEHALSLLEEDIAASPSLDAPEEDWRQSFQAERNGDGIAIDGIPSSHDSTVNTKSRWIYMHDERGKLMGRYAVLIDDEAGKININTASALSAERQHQGVDTFEILLSDGKGNGLPLSVENSAKIVNYRYGRDNSPGQVNADDNNTVLMFGNDLLDNNANMIVDEENEGIDEQQEYVSRRPEWDDRAFLSVGEMARTCLEKCTPLSHRLLSRYATVHSRDENRYWTESEKQFAKKINVNTASKYQISKVIKMANDTTQFQASDRNLRQLVCNVIDYRDENQVLTTQGSAYGVEAICFNEIMANNGSYVLPPQCNFANWDSSLMLSHRFGWWYNMRLYMRGGVSDPNYGFKIEYVGPKKGGADVVMNGRHDRVSATTTIKLADDPKRYPNYENSYNNFRKIRKIYGNWVPDLWKNGWLVLTDGLDKEPIRYPIVGNTRDTITIGIDDAGLNTYARLAAVPDTNVLLNAVWIDTLWRHEGAVWSVYPEVSDHWVCPVKTVEGIEPPKNLYYKVYIAENVYAGNVSEHVHDWPLNGKSGLHPWKGYATFLDVDGNPSVQKDTEMEKIYQKELKGTTLVIPDKKNEMYTLRYPYMNGKPVQARDNWISVLITSSKKTGFVGGLSAMNVETAFRNKNSFEMVQFIRPDIVELINISDRPISLHNWRVVINTGSYADQVGLIDYGQRFESRFGSYEDPGAVIPPHGYFYLTNSREIFDLEYGDKRDGQWGSSAGERYPCFELPDALWGVRYKATKVVNNRVYVEGADWDDEQMQYETIEVQGPEPVPGRNEPLRQRRFIWHSGKDWLAVESQASLSYDGVKPGDDIMIQGMPRQGGFLSMTLKNAYKQICARTIEYGSTEPNEIGFSTEKYDPTHYTWVKTEKPTFGGIKQQARNHDHPTQRSEMHSIKDRYFGSVAELQTVRTANDWETLGQDQRGKPDVTALKALGPYLTVSGVRLESEEPGAHVSGWQPAFGIVDACHGDIITASNISWQPGIWQSSLLCMLNGRMQKDTFVIENNSARGVQVKGYGSMSGKRMRASVGDMFSVGPGYSSCMYYSIRESDPGEWEWKNKGLLPANYDLYIYGLSDSIDTTEFLEENFNTEMEIEAYNFVTRAYDALPLGNTAADEQKGRRWQQYDKSDGIYCGEIAPDHISTESGIRLRITPHNLNQEFCSGFAWFDYAYLAPGQSSGKINVNTASPRVLRALNNVTPQLADNIAAGIAQDGKKHLRPYKNITDILNVRGMKVDTFSKICNLITTRSDQFRIRVQAEAVNDVNNDGKFSSEDGDTVLASSRMNAVVDRSTLTDNNPATSGFTIQVEE